MRGLRLLTSLLITLLVVACDESPTGLESDFTFAVSRPRISGGPSPPPTVEGGTGWIVVRGSIVTGDPCYRVGGLRQRIEGGWSVRVIAVQRTDVELCLGVAAVFDYIAVLTELDPGTYRVEIVHQHHSAGRVEDSLVLEAETRVS